MKPQLLSIKNFLVAKFIEATNVGDGRDGISVLRRGHPADSTQEALQREITYGDLDRNPLIALNIRSSLQRISNGRYGVCLECEGPLPQKRLATVPWAQLCISCQETFEPA